MFDERPLSSEIQKYCVQDVIHIPALRELYRAKLCDVWWRKIEVEKAARIALSQGKFVNGQGMHMAKAPAGWEHSRPSWTERQSRSLLTSCRDSVASSSVALRETISAQVCPMEGHDSDLLLTLGALSIQGSRSGFKRSYQDERDFDNEDDKHDRDDDTRDFAACNSK